MGGGGTRGGTLPRRKLGRTGLEVAEIGFGAWQLGNRDDWNGPDDPDALRLVAAAVDSGIDLFDTAPNYGAGASETLLGQALAGKRDRVVLVSKFGTREDGSKDFSVARFRESLDTTLCRLRTDHVDALLLHNPPRSMYEGVDPLWDALETARREGKIGHYGASLDRADEAEACLRNTGSEVLEVLFNILHQDVRRAFPSMAGRGTGVIVKIPFDSGWLTGRFDAGTRFTGIRSRWSREVIARRAELVAEIDRLTGRPADPAARALAYVLGYDAVSCVIPGMRTPEQLRGNVAAAGTRLSGEERTRLEAFWESVTEGGTRLLPW